MWIPSVFLLSLSLSVSLSTRVVILLSVVPLPLSLSTRVVIIPSVFCLSLSTRVVIIPSILSLSLPSTPPQPLMVVVIPSISLSLSLTHSPPGWSRTHGLPALRYARRRNFSVVENMNTASTVSLAQYNIAMEPEEGLTTEWVTAKPCRLSWPSSGRYPAGTCITTLASWPAASCVGAGLVRGTGKGAGKKVVLGCEVNR